MWQESHPGQEGQGPALAETATSALVIATWSKKAGCWGHRAGGGSGSVGGNETRGAWGRGMDRALTGGL